MANVTDTVKNLDAAVNVRCLQTLKSGDFSSHTGGEKRCETLVRTAVVVTMLLVVWALIIVSAASPFFPHLYKENGSEEVNGSSILHEQLTKTSDATTVISNRSTVLPTINCSNAFFVINDNCFPQCNKWKQYSDDVSTAVDAVVMGSSAARVAFGIIALIASCVNRRKMFAFPAILIIHVNVSVVGLGVFVLISISDRNALFCSSPNLIDAISEPTIFCSVSAVVYYYLILHIYFCCFCYGATFFWHIRFPFHARKYKNNGTNKFLYAAVLVPAFVLPTVPAIAGFATGGFTIRQFPPTLCVMNNGYALYGTVIVPMSVMTAIGAPLLILIVAELIKRRCIKEQNAKKKENAGLSAVKKVLFILCYVVSFCSISFASNSLNLTFNTRFFALVTQYFACEANGYDSNKTCASEKMAVSSDDSYIYCAVEEIETHIY